MLVVGSLDSIVDVAQNAHGFRVQRRYGRSIVNTFHGVWSIGAVAGGLLGSFAAGLGVPLPLHLGISAAAGSFVEDAGSSWGALDLRDELGAGAAVGGLTFVSLQVAMTVGRLTGDRVVDRFGQRRVARLGGFLTAVGMGFALAGLGVATLIPAVMPTADELPGLPPGLGLTAVSWLLRVGFLVSPTVVGVVADAASLRVALLSVVLAGVVVLGLGRVLRAAVLRAAVLRAV